ncbi:MAG: metalloregulator ArsR/SmtB family transcription factor [Pseudomonadota bacterium]
MPSREVIAKELAEIFKLVSHPDRIRIIEELAKEEQDVNTLASALSLPGTRVSQHLSKLRAYRFVEERRDGRHHYYHLTHPEIAQWIVDGVEFIEKRANGVSDREIRTARQLWSTS